MFDIVGDVLPLILIFLLGAGLRKGGILVRSDADLLLKLFFHVSLPALILVSIPRLTLTARLFYLPLTPVLIILATYVISSWCGKAFRLEKSSYAVFLIGSMIMNGGFAFPFILTAYGDEGMALAALFDFGGAVMVFTFVYFQACRYGVDGTNGVQMLRKFLLSPPLIALSVAVAMNLAGRSVSGFGYTFLRLLADMTTPLVLLALGVAFNGRVLKGGPTLAAVSLRMFLGFLLGLACAELFGLSGLPRTVTLIMASAPSGVNTLAFSSLEGLDTEFAASIVSYATVLGMIWLPLLIYVRA